MLIKGGMLMVTTPTRAVNSCFCIMTSNKKNPNEASNIFHSIIKASVSKKTIEEKDKVKPKPKK